MPGPEEEVTKLTKELEKLRSHVKDQEEALHMVVNHSKEQGEALKTAMARVDEQTEAIKGGATASKPLVVMSSRRIERFRDRPTHSSDPTIQEWTADIRNQALSKKLDDGEFAALILDHLGGKARQEIMGRGTTLEGKPEEMLKVLQAVFGDGHSLPVLQQRFYAYRQEEEDILDCSLKLVELYDRIVALDPSFKPCREASLKGRFAEAVKDEGLCREMRRLNEEAPELSFFDMRDRALKWLGAPRATKSTLNQEVKVTSFEALLKKQEDMLAEQQKQIALLIGGVQRTRRPSGPRKCCVCGSLTHLKAKCPENIRAGAAGGRPSAGSSSN